MPRHILLCLACCTLAAPAAFAEEEKPFASLKLTGQTRWITGMAFSPDGKMFAATHAWSHGPNFVTLWEASTGKRLRTIDGPSYVRCGTPVAFTDDGSVVAVGGCGEIVLADTATGKRLHLLDANADVLCMAFSPDGSLLATAGEIEDEKGKEQKAEIILWDVKTGKEQATIATDDTTIRSVGFSADGKTLHALTNERDEDGFPMNPIFRTWDVATRKANRSVAFKDEGAEGNWFRSASLSRRGETVVVYWMKEIHVWDTASEKRLGVIEEHESKWRQIYDLAPDGKTLVVLNARRKEEDSEDVWEMVFDMWDLKTWKSVSHKVPEKRSQGISSPYFERSPSGDAIAFETGEGSIALWKTATLIKPTQAQAPTK